MLSCARSIADRAAAQIAKGRQLFLVGCSFCHGQNGEGVRTINGKQYGPSLVGVGAAAVDFQVGTGRMPAQQPGAQIPQNRVKFDQDEIDALGAFVASLGPGPSVPTKEDYDATGASEALTEGIIDHLRTVDGTLVAAVVRDQADGGRAARKVSMRSTDGQVDVSAIARVHGAHPIDG